MASDDSGYGFSTISIDQNTIVAGNTYVNNGNGGAYVFVKPSRGWHGTMMQTEKLTASDAFYYMGFAGSLSVTETRWLLGALTP